MLIIFSAIAVLGVTTFIIQRLSQNEAYQVKTSCIYLAQAGIHNAIYWYRYRDLTDAGYFSLGKTDINANNSFVLGGSEADLLMVNTSNSYTELTGEKHKREEYLKGLTAQNATNSKTITIDRMIVNWNTSRRLREISIDGSRVWLGNRRSPTDCNIKDFTLDITPTIYNIDYLLFDQDMSDATISIEFLMQDGSRKGLTVYPASENYSFTVKSTGKTPGSNIYRTIQATYNTLAAKITGYNEIDEEITP